MSDWRHAALCRDEDPELWFALSPETTQLAVEICNDCPVLTSCREWAVRNLPYGVAGGLTETERTHLRTRSAA